MIELNYELFASEFEKLTNINVLEYKRDQMSRRIENFTRKKGIKSTEQLVRELKKDKVLLKELESEITINVTEFFRNENLWKDFVNIAVPDVKKNKRKLRFWSAACSSGEEPYTIAMLMKENFPNIDIEIIATDLDEIILEKAKKGHYLKRELITMDPNLVKKYFDEVDEKTMKIKDIIKQKVRFKRHNLLNDRYPKGIDIIVCRNVLIYFNDETKNKVYEKFVQSLNDEGVLFIGATEQIFRPNNFQLKLLKSFFYKKSVED